MKEGKGWSVGSCRMMGEDEVRASGVTWGPSRLASVCRSFAGGPSPSSFARCRGGSRCVWPAGDHAVTEKLTSAGPWAQTGHEGTHGFVIASRCSSGIGFSSFAVLLHRCHYQASVPQDKRYNSEGRCAPPTEQTTRPHWLHVGAPVIHAFQSRVRSNLTKIVTVRRGTSFCADIVWLRRRRWRR